MKLIEVHMPYVFEVFVYFKVDSVVYNSVPDPLLYHETIKFKGTSKPFKIISYITCI